MCPCGVVPPPSSTYPRGPSRSPPRSLPGPLDGKLPITDFCLPRPTATNCPPPLLAGRLRQRTVNTPRDNVLPGPGLLLLAGKHPLSLSL
ncbi:hypothetical protein AVEN_62882-1 [Araneus ventricosus]|uniref:Uncharacterized protein n=1 Tax=Araneus ventricosus TaxID=182803 RepID=A0A4Y2SU88_ARAVE|nr:hypothetical protein AVEN_35434-1 [Araneus ventricosus]GBN90749.1 hypothetical protein AVEN_62882-1 [Araneus ventricosus]